MNKRELKKLLVKKADETEIKDLTDNILSNVNHQVQVSDEVKEQLSPERQPKRFRLSLITAIASVCLVITFILAGTINLVNVNNTTKKGLEKQKNVFSREVFALGNIAANLNSMNDDLMNINSAMSCYSLNNMLSLYESDDADDTEEEKEDSSKENKITQEEMNKIAKDVNYYLLTGNAFMEKNNMDMIYSENTDSAYSKYAHKVSVSYKDVQNYMTNYVAYFNYTERDDGDKIEGLLVVDGESYTLEGETKNENNEVEMELKIIFKDNSYISIENETEINENEYEYKYYKDGVLLKGVKMEVENDDGERELSVEIAENGVTEICEFKFQDKTIECNYKKGDVELEILIYIHDVYYLYQFEYNEPIRMEKATRVVGGGTI